MSSLKEQLIAGATSVGTVVACVAIGYAVGKDTNDGLVNFLREKSQISEKTENQLRAEVSALKLELQNSKQQTLALPANPALASAAPSASAGVPPKQDDLNSVRVVLKTGETISPFDGKIYISLVGISYQGVPLRHVVSATIGSTGKPSKALDSIDVGFSVVYEGYEVRVVASDTFTGTFLLTKLQPKV